jgi:hypothetical protein
MRRFIMLTAAVLLPVATMAGCGSSGGGHGGSATSGTSAANLVTKAQVQRVLSQFTAVNNRSNKLRQDGLLATYEGGSSYEIDAGLYRWTLSNDPSNKYYQTVSYTDPQFFIPRQSGYPAWFAVRATEVNTSTQTKQADAYLVFTKASASAKWLQVREPNAFGLPAQAQPQVTTAAGYATQVSPSDASGLTLSPDQIPAQDVTFLDVGNIPTKPARPGLPTPKRPKVINFANGKDSLTDLSDTTFWSKRMPQGSSVIDSHQTTKDQVYALRTSGGGVLAFYDLTASLTLGAPFAQPFSITIPGFFDGKKQSTSFQLNYVDQFVVYEPAGAGAAPQVLGTQTALVSGECAGVPCT